MDDDMFNEDFSFMEEYENKHLEFLKKLIQSPRYLFLSKETRNLVELNIKALEGDADALISLSVDLLS